MNGQGKVFIKILVKELLMKGVCFFFIFIFGLFINNFFSFEAASRAVFTADSEQDLNERDSWKIIEENLDKERVACTTGEYAIYHPEVVDIEELNRKADEAAKTAVEQKARETEEYVENCIEREGFLQERLSCKRRGDLVNKELYKEYFDEARQKFLGEALTERNEALLEREKEYLEELLSKKEQARQKSQEVVSTYESAQSINSPGERGWQEEIEVKRERAVDYLKEELEILDRVNRCYNMLRAVITGEERYREYNYDVEEKKLANLRDRDPVVESLKKLGVSIIPITGDEKYVPGAGGWYRITD